MPCSLLYLTALLIFSVLSSQPLITPPSPTVRHTHTHPRSFLSETKDSKINLCPSLLRLLTLLRGDFGYWRKAKAMLKEKGKGKSIKILWVQSYRGIWLKTLQQMLHETATRDLPSHLLSKWDAAFLPFPLLPAFDVLSVKGRQERRLNAHKNDVCGGFFFLNNLFGQSNHPHLYLSNNMKR